MTSEAEIIALDRFIDSLGSEPAPAVDDPTDASIAGLAETVLELRRRAEPIWPHADFPTRAAARIAEAVRETNSQQIDNPPVAAPPQSPNGRAITALVATPAMPSTKRRWLKEFGQIAAAALTLALVAGLLVLLLGNFDGSRFGRGPSQPTSESPSFGQIGVPASCPVTTAPSPRFIPPAPYSSTPYPDVPGNDDFWYGSPDLWTFLAGDGSLVALHDASDYTFRMLWFSQDYNFWQAQAQPSITFSGVRLDGPARALTAIATNAYAAEFHSSMIVGFSISTPGCWKITADYEGNTLSVVVWVEQQAPGTPTSGTPTPQADRSKSRVYLQAGNSIDVLDAGSGQIIHQLPVHMATQSIFLSADHSGQHLFVTDAPMQNGQAVDELTVYNTNDWSIERQVPVPDIIRTLDGGSGIAASNDGGYVYVYNYNDRTRGSGPVKYWLTTLDVMTGQWIEQKVDLPSCGVNQLMVAGPSGLVYVRCADTNDLRVIDPIKGTVDHSIARVATMAIEGGSLYTVSPDGRIQVYDAAAGNAHTLDGSSGGTTELDVPSLPLGTSTDGRVLFVASGTTSEIRQGFASAISVIDTNSGNVLRTLRATQPFRWVAFSPDGSAAYVDLVGNNGESRGLARLDLKTGEEATLLHAEVAPDIVVTP